MIKLSEIPTTPPEGLEEKIIDGETDKLVKKIASLQERLFAEKKHSLLIVLQGMDASGKDGIAKNVFKDCSPLGVDAHSFRKPTDEEFAHDFLWRAHQHTPRRGNIQIFVRSHYEDVLIQRVHKWIDETRVKNRMEAINHFERLLEFDNHTTVLKFYLHISRSKQKEKLDERKKEPNKYWKHNPDDQKEAALWDDYMRCYEDVLNGSTIPWHIIPVDKRWYRDYLVAKIVASTLDKINPQFPPLK